ncbi:PREDICTED: probable multidrug resistance-associated protein lethal(2)03659 isoform X2 [Cyphomyrmex costatus]|uniref:probable multidrug resistance-associated protein lethal(2)03659 isoform X2 n=1 Tax=Cyphomyrmex costatus TaxID=456900 RepID=UPI0008522B79|nr:PREDICTED: probable multidrug resistance-associated protein lethal(2)03659 isoform X2 [Cyphomyrmex costatus]
MDGKVYTEKVKNPRADANIFSVLTFSWMLRLFWVGYHRDLEVSDMYTPLKEHKSDILGDKLAAAWEKECEMYQYRLNQVTKSGSHKKIKEPSLMKVLIKCFGSKILLYGIYVTFSDIAFRGVLQPLLVGQLLHYFNSMDVDKSYAYSYAVGIILCSAVNVFFTHLTLMGLTHMGLKIRVACYSLIYRKTLKMTRTALNETTIGQIVNLLSNDINRFEVYLIFIHSLWFGPLEAIILTYVMYHVIDIGVSSIIGVASLLMFIPFQVWLAKKSSELRLRTAIKTDERVRLTKEIISGIQAIKMYTWENPFSTLIEKARKMEINIIRWASYIKGITMSFLIFTTRLSLFITVLAYTLFGYKITIEKIYMLTACYSCLSFSMATLLPQGIRGVAEIIVTVNRIKKFLMCDELIYSEIKTEKNSKENNKEDAEKNNKENAKKTNQKGAKKNEEIAKDEEQNRNDYTIKDQPNCVEYSISIKNGSAKWLDYEQEYTLHNINMNVRPNELIAVVGQVGAGKSSLLNIILKELRLQKGFIQINGKIAYASQESWLFSGSMRQNILFGRKMDQIRYNHVIKVCQLKRDFSLLPYGDKTIIGERGITLSGGQRARVNLARAIYADVDIYLMDDPLSAVDAHVGKYIFEKCINKYLQSKTRILVTHQFQYLRNVDRIIVLKNGTIQAEGTYDELSSMRVNFGRLLENQWEANEKSSRPSLASVSRSNSHTSSIKSLSSFMADDTSKHEPDEVAEMRTVGNVSNRVYTKYFCAGGNLCVIFIMAMLFIITQLIASSVDYFLARWVDMEEHFMNQTNDGVVEDPRSPLTRMQCIYIYSGLIVLTICISFIRSWTFFWMCMRASVRLHDRMFHSISRATMRFFNINTSGRILNRFSKDMGGVDEILPALCIDSIQINLWMLGIIVLVAISNVWLLIPTAFIGIVFYYLRTFYLATSRSVKRLEGITRSPIFAHLNATLEGLPTVRAFEAETILTKEFDNYQDLHTSATYIFIATTRAFGFWLDVVCVLYITLVTLSFLVLDNNDRGSMNSEYVGLAITQSINITGMFQWGIRQSAELENQMTSVERILEYSKVDSEPPLESAPDKKPKCEWPQKGKIEFKNVFLCYTPCEPPVLKNISFVIFPREKIGIVGRTGAGKSSLIQALFRLTNVDGLIEIDNVDTSQLGLHDLRSKISIIPQEPYLFSGSLRRNLDPFNSYRDELLWQALKEVELKELNLETHINEGGSNLSVGQRQLVCLARAIVRNNPILVLDEATANVDPRTDELIQTTIRRKFKNCTVLTIAHRLNTIMDSDRILVMDAGIVVKETGYLKSMVQETSKEMEKVLTDSARNCYQNRSQRFDVS